MNSCELVTFISGLACSIASCHTEEETALLAAVFMQLADSLETILAQQVFCKKVSSDNSAP